MNEQNGKLSNIKFEMILDDFKGQLHLQIQYHGELAKLYKARFDALVKEGFTQEQALEIVKDRGINQ
ncbi:hypothetical protein EYB35_00035 [Bacillus paranthracis]|nr:hypothetical protein EYB35_00035 [Bacillus paranthracis]